MKRSWYPAIVVFTLFAMGCASSRLTSRFSNDRGACEVPAELLGEWRSRRMTQIGPGSMAVTLDCNCRYTTSVRMALGHIVEEGEYRVQGDTLVFSRSSGGEISWPYTFDGEKLVLVEAAGESHPYTRTKRIECREPESRESR